MLAVALAFLLQAYAPQSTRGWDGLVPTAADRTLESSDAGRAFVFDGQTASLGGHFPGPVLLAVDDNRLEYVSVSFHSVWLVVGEAGARRPVWFARLRRSRGPGVSERFADSRRCPMIVDALILAEQIEAPTLDFVGIPEGALPGDDEGPDIRMDDVTYTLSASGAFARNNAYAKYSASGDGGSPVGAWGRVVLASLSHCWSRSAPPEFASSPAAD